MFAEDNLPLSDNNKGSNDSMHDINNINANEMAMSNFFFMI